MNPLQVQDILNRRIFLKNGSTAIGGAALTALMNQPGQQLSAADANVQKFPTHEAKAKRIIYLFQSGAPSQMDLFDPKPQMKSHHGEDLPESIRQGQRLTTMTSGQAKFPVAPSVFDFAQHGNSGMWFSNALTHMPTIADKFCMIRSMHTEAINHDPAITFCQTGSQLAGRPSIGSWVSYGLGTPNKNLPSFLVLSSEMPYAGTQVWASDFLPGAHQGTRVVPGAEPIANLKRRVSTDAQQKLELDALAAFNEAHRSSRPGDAQLAARIKSFETAYGMQSEMPEALDLSKESDSTLGLYGLKRGESSGFGWQCLVARRLVERGVRFVELIHTGSSGNWDSHGNMADHGRLAKQVDQPIAGLLEDLKRTGQLDETLVVWTTEFGRTPFNNTPDNPGREHHNWGFSSWLAGAGVKKGYVHGATDEHGIRAEVKPVHVHDFHATILHLMGLEHTKLTYRHGGRDYRLTDVHGNVVSDVLA